MYWENALETDEKGEAEFEFPNADVTTNYRITVAGFSDDGQIGLNTEKYFVQMPFALQTAIVIIVLLFYFILFLHFSLLYIYVYVVFLIMR